MWGDDLNESAVSIEDAKREPPRPLLRDPGKPEPFPLESTGAVLAPAAAAIVDIVKVPPAIASQSVLAAAALATQGLADVELPTGRACPLSCFFITVAASGDRKSSSDGYAMKPVKEREKNLRQQHEVDRQSYEWDRELWEADKKKIMSSKQKDDREQRLAALGPSPQGPLLPLLTCPEPTMEGLCRAFMEGQPSIGIFSDEGGQFIAGHGMNSENRLRTAAALSGLWDGEPIKRVRAGDGTVVLPGRRASIHLMAQPEAASHWLSDRMLIDQGLLSRALVVAPQSMAGSRLWSTPQKESFEALQSYHMRISHLLERELPMSEGFNEGLQPRLIGLSRESCAAWIAFANNVERQLGQNGPLHPISGLANKLPEHAARLAGVIAMTSNPDTAEIALEDMERGIVLAEHYASEALRLHGAGQIPGELKDAHALHQWIVSSWKEEFISPVDVYQVGPNRFRTAAKARKLLLILEDHRHLDRMPEGAVVGGVQRREAWRIVREKTRAV